jgi:MFS family permease
LKIPKNNTYFFHITYFAKTHKKLKISFQFCKNKSLEKMKAAATQWSRIAGRLSVLLVLHILHNSVNAVRMAVLFPYIRTTISCTSTTSSVNDRSSEYWSGSLFCNDKDYVAKQAQAYYGYAMGINLIVQFIAISALGALADLFGRKPVMILAWTGIFIET